LYDHAQVLVQIVKLAQKRGMKGEMGGWKEFLKVYDKKFGASMSDPARRTSEALLAFLQTFKAEEDLKVMCLYFFPVRQIYLLISYHVSLLPHSTLRKF